jgi:hypothetical protein
MLLVVSSTMGYLTQNTRPDFVEQDPNDWWKEVVSSTKAPSLGAAAYRELYPRFAESYFSLQSVFAGLSRFAN